MQRLLRAFLLSLGSAALMACHETTAPKEDVTGVYDLTQADGESVPQFRSLSVMSGSIELKKDGTATRQVTYLFRQSGEQIVTSAHGTYSVLSGGVQFTMMEDASPGNPPWRPFASRAGDVLQLHYAGVDTADVVEVYVRQHLEQSRRR